MALDRDFKRNNIPLAEKEPGPAQGLPEVFSLVESSAPVQDIVQQIFTDFYSPERDPEKTALGFMALSEMGSNGEAALGYIKQDSGELGQIARQLLLSVQKGSEENIEGRIRELLGIKKYTNIRTDIDMRNPDSMPKLFNEAKKAGYIEGDFGSFIIREKERARRYVKREGLSPHINGEIENEVISVSASFGIHELIYLSMLSPMDILRLRSKNKPNFMLIGSLGKYSAQEFSDFGKKINSSALCHVPDILPDNIKYFQQIENSKDLFLTINDALQMGYQSDSTDLACTNYLLEFLVSLKAKKFDPSKSNVSKLLGEAYRVLKKGGSLLMIEHRFGEYKNKNIPFEDAIAFLKKAGREAGFAKVKISEESYVPILRKDVSPAEIDANGFVHSDRLLIESTEEQAQIRFIK